VTGARREAVNRVTVAAGGSVELAGKIANEVVPRMTKAERARLQRAARGGVGVPAAVLALLGVEKLEEAADVLALAAWRNPDLLQRLYQRVSGRGRGGG
jgi:hypothetical protein